MLASLGGTILLPPVETPAFDDLQMLTGTLEWPVHGLKCNTKGPTAAAIEFSHSGVHIGGQVPNRLLCVGGIISGIGQRLMQLKAGETIQVWVSRADIVKSANLRIWQLSLNGKVLLAFDAARLDNDALNVRGANLFWYLLGGLGGGCCLMLVAWWRNRPLQLSAGRS